MSFISIEGYDPAHLSWSTFDSYRSCGTKFYLQKVRQLEQRPNWASIGGSAVHSCIEEIELLKLDDVNEVEMFADQWHEHMAKTIERSPNIPQSEWYVSNRGKKTQEWWLEEGPRMVRRWLDWRAETQWTLWRTPTGLPGVEVEMNFTLPGDIPVKAFIDSVWVLPSGQITCLDAKSGRIPQYPEQLGLYRVGLKTLFDVDVDWGYFWDASKGTHGQPIPLGRYTPDYLAMEFRSMIAGVNAGAFPSKPQMNCQMWCSVARFCPAVGGELAATIFPHAVN